MSLHDPYRKTDTFRCIFRRKPTKTPLSQNREYFLDNSPSIHNFLVGTFHIFSLENLHRHYLYGIVVFLQQIHSHGERTIHTQRNVYFFRMM